MAILKSILGSPWFNGFTFVTSIVLTIILAVVGIRRGTRLAAPRYWIEQTALLDGKFDDYPDMKITYGGHAVKRLTVAQVAFWNGGSAPIRGADVAPKSPIRVQLGTGDATILGSSAVGLADEAKELTTEGDPHGITIRFLYLDPEDGCTIRFFHDGPVTQPIEVVGRVQGLRFVDDQHHSRRLLRSFDPLFGLFEWLADPPTRMPFLSKVLAAPLVLILITFMLAAVFPALTAQGMLNLLDRQPKRFRP